MPRHVNTSEMQPPIFVRDGERQYFDGGEFIPVRLCHENDEPCGAFYSPSCPVPTHRVKWKRESLEGILA